MQKPPARARTAQPWRPMAPTLTRSKPSPRISPGGEVIARALTKHLVGQVGIVPQPRLKTQVVGPGHLVLLLVGHLDLVALAGQDRGLLGNGPGLARAFAGRMLDSRIPRRSTCARTLPLTFM